MKRINICSKNVLEYEVREIIQNLKNDDLIELKIIGNPIKKGTFDLEIKYFEEVKRGKKS